MGTLNRALGVMMAMGAAGCATVPHQYAELNNLPPDGSYVGRSRSRQPTCKKTRADIRVPNRKKNKAARLARKGNRK